jgi:uncharacterized protein (TIGR02217 family)
VEGHDVTFKAEQLPDGVDLSWESGSGWFTRVVEVASGRERRNQGRANNKLRFRVSYNARQREAWEAFMAFFDNMAGMAHTWLLRDPRHNVATAAQGRFAVIDGTHAQMVLRVTAGGSTYDRPITKPSAVGIAFQGGSPTSYSTTTGILTHSGLPDSWTGPFFICARFAIDDIQATGVSRQQNGDYVAGYKDVPIVEVVGE